MKSNHADLCKTITELTGEELVAEHGYDQALRLYGTERDRLTELEKSIIEASVALQSDTIVNHLHKLTGVQALLIELYGAEKVKSLGTVEVLKELIEEWTRFGELLKHQEPPAVEEKAEEPEAARHRLVMGRIVRYVEHDGEVIPALVTKAMDNQVVALQAFPVRSAPYPVTAVNYSLGPMVNTWHWPND